jgi:hypothetical protein
MSSSAACDDWAPCSFRGMEAAVKVLHHSKAATVSVAHEVELMMSLQHKNIVAAYHFVTWRRQHVRQVDSADGVAEVSFADGSASGVDRCGTEFCHISCCAWSSIG